MAKRIRNIDITTWAWAEYMNVWCDFRIQEKIEGIEGVAWVEQRDIPENCRVHYDARYSLDEIVTEMRELADNKSLLSAGSDIENE